jgi:NAD(P)-dependent dehydrogenase (short-subunit alcohol dehydrogenase family)
VPVLGVMTDVSSGNDVERLAEQAISRFGAVHLLFNNAGVGLVGPRTWECTRADWEWILGVNLWGVVHGVRVFVPIMIDQATECHIVNTASAAGLLPMPGIGIYGATKAALIMLSETLRQELCEMHAPIKVTVVCPGPVKTRIADAARNRPAVLQNDSWVEVERRAKYEQQLKEVREAVEAGMSPEEVAERVFDAIRGEKFYVFTHSWVQEEWQSRVKTALRGARRHP